jgi:hypothetical protein
MAAALVLAAVGLPVLQTWRTLLLAAAFLWLAIGVRKPGAWRLVSAAAAVLVVVGAKGLLPRADLAEAHNAFMVMKDGEPLEQGLPPVVFHSWKAEFDELYPPDLPPYAERSQWRANGGTPRALFTQSADAIWRTPKFTRQVDTIDFRNLGEFRGGFANEIQYNFWAGELLREEMPFYVMYELTPAAAGSRLAWRGKLFWEQAHGEYEQIDHSQTAARTIEPRDAGRRVYAVFFPKRDPQLYFRFEPSLKLQLAAWTNAVLTVAAIWLVVGLTFRPRRETYFRTLLLFAGGYAIMAAFLSISAGKYLGSSYPPQGGGDDGLVHESWGRTMALLAGRGEVREALRGTESVYWFTPGTRYFRMLEKLIFGDTNHLYALVVACAPVIVFYLLRRFVTIRWTWILTAAFCLVVAGNFSYLNYLANAKLGYGEALAGELFLLGLLLLLRMQPAWGGTERSLVVIWTAGAALAASMFIRPNFAIAAAWLGAAGVWAWWRARDAAAVAALALGLMLVLWMPFHNWYYGHEFYLISKAGSTVSLSLGVGDYAAALRDVVRGQAHSDAAVATFTQIKGWLWNPGLLVRPELKPFAWFMHVIELTALAVSCLVALRWVVHRFETDSDIAVVAVAAVCAHIPMLFIFTTHYRYAMLGWDLAIVVLIASVARRHQAGSIDKVAV